MNLITICIPTYNQCKKLEILLNQIHKYNPNISIVVSDNNSTDNTKKIIRKYQKKLKYLIFIKNNKNRGFDLNYLKTVKKVKTDYFWVLGSDEKIYNKSILKINKIIKKLNFPDGITFVNNTKKINNFKNKENFEKFKILTHSNYLGTISLNIIKKNKFITKKFIKTNFGYIQIYYCIKKIVTNNNWYLYKYNSITKIDSNSIELRNNKKKYLERLDIDIKGYIFHIIKLLKKKNISVIKYKNLIFKKNIRPWIMESLMHHTKKEVITVLKKNSKYLRGIFYYKFLKLLINICPIFLIRFLIKTKRIFI
jgi:glycosyltransferase involved in cell wall biosynthesis